MIVQYCAMCIAEMLHNTIAHRQLIFPFLQTIITVQMSPSGGQGDCQPQHYISISGEFDLTTLKVFIAYKRNSHKEI